MEPRGCNRWQAVANRAAAKTAHKRGSILSADRPCSTPRSLSDAKHVWNGRLR